MPLVSLTSCRRSIFGFQWLKQRHLVPSKRIIGADTPFAVSSINWLAHSKTSSTSLRRSIAAINHGCGLHPLTLPLRITKPNWFCRGDPPLFLLLRHIRHETGAGNPDCPLGGRSARPSWRACVQVQQGFQPPKQSPPSRRALLCLRGQPSGSGAEQYPVHPLHEPRRIGQLRAGGDFGLLQQ